MKEMTKDLEYIPLTLTGKQKKILKGLGHHLTPLICIGKEGMTDSLLKATRQELFTRELIKVKIGTNSTLGKKEAADLLPQVTESTLVQLIGKTLLLYKENPEMEKGQRIALPRS
jgi:RNA-binding protein